MTLFELREPHDAPKVLPRVQKGSKMGSQSYGQLLRFGGRFLNHLPRGLQGPPRDPPGGPQVNPRAPKWGQFSLKIRPTSMQRQDTNLARIYLHTLSPFTDYRNGSYAMSALKKMTGTKGFLGLPDAEKRCQEETLDECNSQKYFDKVRTECHCTLWALDNKREVGTRKVVSVTEMIFFVTERSKMIIKRIFCP